MFHSNEKKSIRFEDVEQNLFDWFISMGSGTPGLTGNLLLEKARQIARREGFDEAEKLKRLEKKSDFVFKIKNQRVSQSNITDYFQSG